MLIVMLDHLSERLGSHHSVITDVEGRILFKFGT